MKKSFSSKHLLFLVTLLIGANLCPVRETLTAKPKVFYAPKKKVRVISCYSNGEIVAYGNECDTGASSCVANGCPS